MVTLYLECLIESIQIQENISTLRYGFESVLNLNSFKIYADEEVTLLKPYKDTNYVLNVPYSTKTETGFIPTISGNWVANGKVYLD